jgi:hypothetical protein
MTTTIAHPLPASAHRALLERIATLSIDTTPEEFPPTDAAENP